MILYLVRRTSGILKREQNISKDGGGGGVCKRGVCIGGRTSVGAKAHSC